MQKLLYGVAGLLALLIVIGLAMPRTHRIEVSTEIDSNPSTLFVLLNDFRRHALWSSLTDADAGTRFLYSGADTGTGATMSWNGVAAGSGMQTIVESDPYERVTILINPGEPGEAVSVFSLTPGPGVTTVSRSFEVDYGMNLVGRYFAPIFGRIVARDYQQGLDRLKELAENLPKANFGDLAIERTTVGASTVAYVATGSRPDADAMDAAMDAAYFQVSKFIETHGLSINGAPLLIVHSFEGPKMLFDAAIPVSGVGETTPTDGTIVGIRSTYAGPVILLEHRGSHRLLANTHRKVSAYLAAAGLERNGPYWESYVSDPARVPEPDLVTQIVYPVKPVY